MTAISRTPTSRQPGQARGIRGFIRRRPLLSYFVLTNVLSWTAWLPYILSATGLGVLPFTYPSFLGGTQLLGVLPGAYLGPILSAFIVTAIADGREGIRHWVGRMMRWKVGWRWYLGTAVAVPAAIIITGLVMSGGEIHMPPVALMISYLPALALQMVTTGLAEEPGWRDFALPRLQRRFGPVLGGVFILGPLWALWHLPLYFSEWGGWPNVTWVIVAEFIAFCCTFSVVVTWVFNRTGQSLPLVMLLHVGVNNTMSVIFDSLFPMYGTHAAQSHVTFVAGLVAAIVVLVATRGRLGYRPETDAALETGRQS